MTLQKQLQQIYIEKLPEREQQYLKKIAVHQNWRLTATTQFNINPNNTLVISADAATLQNAAEKGFATIGYQPQQDTGQMHQNMEQPFLSADMIVEGFEEVDAQFLDNVFKRHHHIPWTILETRRCIIRELELSDLDALFALYEQPGMTDYMEGLYPYAEEKEYQKAYIRNMYGFYGYGMWLVFEKKTGKLIGRVGVEHREELEGELELGYAIGTSYQHQGYATEVCKAVLAYVKEHLEFHTIVCLIESGNTASIAFARKLGFCFERKRTVDEKVMLQYRISF